MLIVLPDEEAEVARNDCLSAAIEQGLTDSLRT